MAELARNLQPEPATAAEVARGTSRLLLAQGLTPLLEFTLPNGRRLDIAALAPDGSIAGVEIKVSLADLGADEKWPDYLGYCDLFFFAVPPEFPQATLPSGTGIIVADRFGGAIVREAPRTALASARRRALTLRFGMIAAERLTRTLDPNCI